MLQTSTPLVTRRDFEKMPEGPPYSQLIEGNLIFSPSHYTFHQSIVGTISILIANFLDKHPIGEVFVGPFDVFLDDHNIYEPDVLFVSNQRRSIITSKGVEGAPDLVVETLSPSTAHFDKGPKRKIYARYGVKEFWLVAPETRTLQVYLLAKDAEIPHATYDDKATFESALLLGLRIKTAPIFKSPIRK